MAPLTPAQLFALGQNEDFKLRVELAISTLCYTALGTAQGEMTDEEYARFLQRALRLAQPPATEGDLVRRYVDRIFKTLLGSSLVQAAEEPDGSDITDENLATAVQVIAEGINAYEDLTGEVVI